jgi:hypothetical protein
MCAQGNKDVLYSRDPAKPGDVEASTCRESVAATITCSVVYISVCYYSDVFYRFNFYDLWFSLIKLQL